MPELPEVETVVRSLRRAGLPGATITGARVAWARTLEGLAPGAFADAVTGRRVEACARRGKYIVLTLDGGLRLLVHLRMTGRLRLTAAGAPREAHERAALTLDGGRELRFCDPRKFGRIGLARGPHDRTDALGPEPLGRALTPAAFCTALRARRRQLKPLLLDQAFLAGVGNIYADEALWEARLHPQCNSGALSPAQGAALLAAIRLVLRRGIRNRGTSLGRGQTNFAAADGERGRNLEFVRVFRRTGEPCPRCAAAIVRLVVGQRSTHICPACQRRAT